MNRKCVIAGPYRLARRYAESQGWKDDEYIIVTRGHQLARLDPMLIARIVLVQVHTMAQRVVDGLQTEVERVCSLWPVPMVAAT